MNKIVILFRNKKEQSAYGIDEVILDGNIFSPFEVTADQIKNSTSMNLKGDGQNIAVLSSDVLSFHALED